MSRTLNEWIAYLKDKPLPAMALTIQQVTQLLDSPSATHADYQRVICRDPGFTLYIFRQFGNFKRSLEEPAINLSHALSLLGLAPITSGAKELPVLKKILHGSARQSLYSSYSQAAHAAGYAQQWGLERQDSNPDEMAVSALLHRCGEMALWAYAKDEMKKILLLQQRGLSLAKASEKILGFSLNELSLALAQQWALPMLARDALQFHGAFNPRSLAVMLACELSHESAKNWRSENTLDLIDLAAEYHQLTTDQMIAKIHCQSVDIARNLYGLPLPLAAHELLQLPETASQSVVKQAGKVVKNSPQEPQTTVQPTKNEQPGAAAMETPKKKTEPPKPVTQSIKPEKPAATRKPGLQEKVARIMKDLRETGGLDRVMFAMLTPDRKLMKSRFVLGGDMQDAIHQLEISLEPKNLFSILLAKQQGFWLNSKNQEKYSPLIPENSINTLNNKGFFASSLYLRNKPIGMLYADCSDPEALTTTRFSHFKQLSQRLCNELAQ